MKRLRGCRLAVFALLVTAGTVPCPAQPYFDAPWRAFDSDQSSGGPGRYLVDVTTGDLNDDGLPDVVAGQAVATGGVRVFLNQGKSQGSPATFAEAVFYPTANGVWGVTTADLDADGDLDIAATDTDINFLAKKVAILLNDGDGSFAAPTYFDAGPFGPSGIAAADFDKDDDIDLAVANYGLIGFGTTVSVLLNDGAGGFGAPISYTVAPGPFRIAAGDLDLDGNVDLVVAHDEDAIVSVLLGDGGGGFGSPLEFANIFSTTNTGIYSSVVLLDPDGDGDLDIAYTSSYAYEHAIDDGEIALLRNDGSRAFTIDYYPYELPYTNVAFDFSAADLNGDGFDDLVGAQFHEAGFLVFLADGSGGFLPALMVASADDVIAVATPDLDADGDPDVVTVNRLYPLMGAHENPGDGMFAVLPAYGSVYVHYVLDLGDVNLDGKIDAVTSHSGAIASSVNVFLGAGDGTFAQSYETPNFAYGFAKLRDLDGDGVLDLLFVSGPSAPPYDFFTARGNGDGTFQAVIRWPIGTCGNAHPGAFDIDDDGDLDVVNTEDRGCPSVPLAGRRLFISLNNGNGTFQPAYTVEAGIFPRNVAAGDFDEDGHLDLVTTANATDALLFGNGDGTFQPWQPLPLDLRSDNLLVEDWDDDGHLDVAALGPAGDGITALALLWGTGAGGFVTTLQGNHPGPSTRIVLTTGDLDADGDLDIMMDGVQDALVFVNDGARSFDYSGRYGLGRDSRAVNFADATGDAIGDLVALVSLDFPPAGLYDGLVVLPGLPLGTTGPGTVPGGRGVSGTPVIVEKTPGGDVTLHWSPACTSTATDYEVYEGLISAGFASHEARMCSTGGATTATLTPLEGNTYYLVVPRNSTREGSYGKRSDESERPPAGSACLVQDMGGCP